MSEEKECVCAAPKTKEDLAKYLKDNLKLEMKSERVRPDDGSVYRYQLTLKLEGSPVSTVQFIA